jgi:hypothetical protein
MFFTGNDQGTFNLFFWLLPITSCLLKEMMKNTTTTTMMMM